MVRTRIAPSPTGMLHIGTVRTALFNYVFARAHGGQYLGRIEDTDLQRSTPEAEQVIVDGLAWLGLTPDEPWVKQTDNLAQHQQAVAQLLTTGHAYECFVTPEELEQMRAYQKENGLKIGYDGRHRNLSEIEKASFVAQGRKSVVRFKLPDEDFVVWQDAVQGEIRYPINELDDFIIMRSDGTPVYNLVVVADDHAMGITHVIRGDDHINNTPKQILLYKAMGYKAPVFAHLPLIHGPDGKKLSKRHGAVSVMAYQEMGYLPAALKNYLMRLGWAMGDTEIFSLEDAAKHFRLEDVNKGAANFDFAKLDWLNAHYLKTMSGTDLLYAVQPFLLEAVKSFPPTAQVNVAEQVMTPTLQSWLVKGLPELASRAKKLPELAASAVFYFTPVPFVALEPKAIAALQEPSAKEILQNLYNHLMGQDNFSHDGLNETLKGFVETHQISFKQLGMPLRVALTGTTNSPSVTHLLEVFGKEESLRRISLALPLCG